MTKRNPFDAKQEFPGGAQDSIELRLKTGVRLSTPPPLLKTKPLKLTARPRVGGLVAPDETSAVNLAIRSINSMLPARLNGPALHPKRKPLNLHRFGPNPYRTR